MNSIDRGVPVLTFGIVGPPTCSIIYGYDENGDVLIGWSQFTDEQNPDDPTDAYFAENYFLKRNGLDKSEALIFIGNKKSPLNIVESVRTSIKNIPKYANLSATDRVVFGKAAFESWADSLSDDTCFKEENDLISPLDTYGSCVVQIATNMHYIQRYLSMATELCPDMIPLIQELENTYQRVKDALKKVSDFQGGYFFDADKNALLQKDFRETLADLIRELGSCYMDVAGVVEKYFAKGNNRRIYFTYSSRLRRLNKNEVFERVIGFTLSSRKDVLASQKHCLRECLCGRTNIACQNGNRRFAVFQSCGEQGRVAPLCNLPDEALPHTP